MNVASLRFSTFLMRASIFSFSVRSFSGAARQRGAAIETMSNNAAEMLVEAFIEMAFTSQLCRFGTVTQDSGTRIPLPSDGRGVRRRAGTEGTERTQGTLAALQTEEFSTHSSIVRDVEMFRRSDD